MNEPLPVWLSVKSAPNPDAPSSASAALAAGADIAIHGRIGVSYWDPSSVGSAAFARALASFPAGREVRVSVNSEGGSIREGLGIYHAIRNHGNVVVVVEGYAASIASVFPLAAKRRVSPRGSLWMVHNPWAYTDATTAPELRAAADMLDAHGDEMVALYVAGTGRTEKEVRAAMDSTTWMTSAQALKWGLATETDGEPVALAALPRPSRLTVPATLLAPADAGAATSAAGVPARETPTQPTENRMEKIRSVLVKAGLIPDTAPATDADLAPVVEASLASLNSKLGTAEAALASAKSEGDDLRAKLTARVKAAAALAVAAAVKAGKLADTPEARAHWVKVYEADPDTAQASLDSINAPPPPAPQAPVPNRGIPAATAEAAANGAASSAEAEAGVKAYMEESDPVKRAALWAKHRSAILAAARR